MKPETILDAEIATGAALIYELDADSSVISKKVLSPEIENRSDL
jgi:bisphosphoglycerate-dependent phosphoglycerate mutase